MVAAQEPPPPPAAAVAVPKPPPSWMLDLVAEEAYESNVNYGPFEGASDFVTSGNLRLTRVFAPPRSTVRLALEGGGAVYRDITELNRFTWGGVLDLRHDFTRRTRLELEGRTLRGYMREYQLDDPGVIPPYALMRTDSGALAFRHSPARRLSLELTGHAERFDFESPALRDGSSYGGALEVERGWGGERYGVGVVGEHERSETRGITYLISRAFAQWRGEPREGLGLRLRGGVASYGATTQPDADVTPVFDGSISGRFGRHTLGLRAARTVAQGYGLGVVGVYGTAYLDYGVTTGPVELGLGGGLTRSYVTEFGPLDPPDTRVGYARLRWNATRRFGVLLEYSYWARARGEAVEVPAGAAWESHALSLALEHRFDWR